MTYNIRACLGARGEWDQLRRLGPDALEDVASVISGAAPDIVALQEVARLNGGVDLDQALVLGQRLGLHHAFGVVTAIPGGWWGNAVLSRYPIVSTATHPIPYAPFDDPRSLLEIRVDVGGRRLTVFSAHLSYRPAETARQARALADRLVAALTEGPVVLAGDLNAPADSPALAPLHGLLHDAFALAGIAPHDPSRWTFPDGHRRARALDHIFVSPSIAVYGCRVVVEEAGVSDHNPVVADVSLG